MHLIAMLIVIIFQGSFLYRGGSKWWNACKF